MSDILYIAEMQAMVNRYARQFQVLNQWIITFDMKEDLWCQTIYDITKKKAVIYACDINDEEAYILEKVLRVAFSACDTAEKRQLLIEDLVSLIQDQHVTE
jgi:hypothetical protein